MKTFKQHFLEKVVLVKRTTKEPYYMKTPPDKWELGFKRYMRSEKQLKKVIGDNYSTHKITIERIAQLAANHKIILVDNIVLDFKTKDVWPWREYTRDLTGDWSGGNTKSEIDKLRKDIQKNGIKNPLMLHISRQDKGVNVYLGEGNHRLGLALELGIPKVPVRFYYTGFG